MPQLSACIEMIFHELPFNNRIPAVAAAGLPAFEFWGWQGKDLNALTALRDDHGLVISSFSGHNGGAIPLVDPANREAVVVSIRESCEVATRLDCRTLIVTTGNAIAEQSRESQHQAVVDTLKAAARVAEDYGVTLVLEPLNILVNHAGYYLVSSTEGFDIIREVARPSVRLLYDVYHQQISEGFLTQTLVDHAAMIGHIHVADTPGRHQPGTGEINYRHIFRVIDGIGYGGYVGLEYLPEGDPLESIRASLRLTE